MYKSLFVAIILVLSLGASVAAAPLDDAVAAAHKGEYVLAHQLLRPLAEKGDARAQFNVGYLYANGWGVEQDPTEAVKWYRKAAAQGLPVAQYYLGMGYAFGEGVPADKIEGARWFRRAADQGYPIAQFALGFAYANGSGVPKDLLSAYMWILLSGQHVVASSAPLVRREIERQMTSAQLAQAEQLAAEWKPEVGQIGPSQARPEELLGLDRHAELADSSIWPISAVGKVTVARYDRSGSCTGTLVGPKLVLTAAHCVQLAGKQLVNPGNVRFLVGMNRGTPATYSVAERLIVSKDFSPGNPKYLSPENSSNDWALILLRNSLSMRPVPVKAMTREQLHTISKSGTIMQVGYGAERPYLASIARKCRIHESGDDDREFLLFRCLSNFGYSGSPILAEINGTPTIIGIASAAIWELLLGIACSAKQFEKPVTDLIGPASNGG